MDANKWLASQGIPDTRRYSGSQLAKVMEQYSQHKMQVLARAMQKILPEDVIQDIASRANPLDEFLEFLRKD